MSYSLDKSLLLQNFNRAAASYEEYALMQQEIGTQLLQRLAYTKIMPENILDLGCGTGFFTRKLANLYPESKVLGIDFAPNMIEQAKEKIDENNLTNTFVSFKCEDAEKTTLADQSIDLIFSNLLFPCCDIPKLLKECFRLLKPKGLLLFTALGPDTLYELNQSWKKVDKFKHVHPFTDMHNLGDALLKQGFKDPVMDRDYVTATFSEVIDLIQGLKLSGAQNANLNRRPGLFSSSNLEKVIEHYESFRNDDHLLPATFEVLYGQAWKPDLNQEQHYDADGSVRISVEKLKSRKN
jgi:malonyl-CoA O-methyltransferase